MNSQHISEYRSLDYLIGEMPEEEKASLERHLAVCSDCQLRVEQYKEVLTNGMAVVASGAHASLREQPLPWSFEHGQRRLCAAVIDGAELTREHAVLPGDWRPLGELRKWLTNGVLRQHLRMASIAAVGLFLTLGFGISVYRLGLKHGLRQLQQSRTSQQSSENPGLPKVKFDELVREREALEASLAQREALISELRGHLEEQRKQSDLLEANLRSASREAQEEAQKISLQRDDLLRKLEDQKEILTATQKEIDAVKQAGTNDAIRVVSLENQIQRMSELYKDKDARIDEQQRMLAADRDIRDLMGARDLYIAEVYDVGGNGKRKKPYGRVFYTKGKSLIFYAYDLDQQLGLKSSSAFQAWGLRGPDRNTALNLGVMYADNSTNKRWVLRFDDPQALQEINAVFVTVEPNGGSRVPQGQQVLFAYLREEPNHP